MQNTAFSRNKTLNLKGVLTEINKPLIMGILNVTPDSFFDGGRYNNEKDILDRVEKLIHDGASFIDIGGYSTRPGAVDISPAEEKLRVLPAIRAIVKRFPEVNISIDTFRSEVAKAAVHEGAAMVNDVSGGSLDEQMFSIVASLKVPYIFMHMKGTPQTMNQFTQYENLVKEILDYFSHKIAKANAAGIHDIIIDPGFGFAKTREQNFQLLNKLDLLKIAGKPILVGLSRKSMVWKTLGLQPEEALNGTTALNTIALMRGADILRVHDVKEAAQVLKLWTALQENS